ncbi:MAG: CopG family ribbon-helix-helix protein [Candidatus Hodarchaeota archaeon]
MEEYKRFTISLPKDLYEEFERFRENINISRSDAIRKAMKALMVSEENLPVLSGNVVGCISIIMTHKHFEQKDAPISTTKKSDFINHVHEIDHDDSHHTHDFVSRPVYSSIQQTDEILKTDIQHHFHDIIISTLHVHLEFEKCLEILAVSGPYQRVKDLKDNLQRLKSVLSVGFFIVDRESKKE